MAVLRATNQTELEQAIDAVHSGDTILLAAGTYDHLDMPANQWNPNLYFTEKVTIKSEDPNNQAVLNQMTLRKIPFLELRDLKFDYVPSKTADDPFWIQNSTHIDVVGCSFEGETKNGLGSGIGLRVKFGDDVTIEDSLFTNFRNGIYATNVTDVDVLDSDFRKTSNDSILMGGMTDVLISGNDFRNAKSDPNLMHKDNIQFYTSSTEGASRDVIIRDNVIDNSEETHGIYFTNTLASDGDLSVKHRNILVEDNFLRTAHTHGITVNHGDGIVIRDNVIVQNPDGGYTATLNVPRINVSTLSTNVTITGNQVSSVQMPANASWTVTNNDIVGPLSHWSGVGATIGPIMDGMPLPPSGNSGNGIAEDFRVDGRKVINQTKTFEDIDFTEGDKIILNFFDDNTFKQINDFNPVDVFNNGAATKMNSVYDLIEIVEQSQDVSAHTQTQDDALILTIVQNAGVFELKLTGLGFAYDDLL